MDQTPEPSPWTRPGFLAAAVLVAVIAAVGVVLAVTSSGDDTKPPAAAPVQTTPAATTTPPSSAGTDSICGLKGTKTSGRLSKAPDAQWDYHGTTAYPVSKDHGPGLTDPSGYRYCYQHTPEGALFMAIGSLAQSNDPKTAEAWAEHSISRGKNREQLVRAAADTVAADSGTRARVRGFRLLSYDPATARVDLGVSISSDGINSIASMVYELVWEDGDWRINSDSDKPVDVAVIPDLSGYVSMGA